MYKLPPRWLNCPRKANSLVADKFIAFKVPLSSKFDQNVPLECRFNLQMLYESIKRTYNMKLGLIIDLTNTSRFYDAESEVKQQGIKYVKINCKGHGETPTQENTQLFLNLVENFIRQNPTSLIGIHCTHGFNRSGFLICSYLVEKLDYSIDMAITLFAQSRPNGIYKQDYIDELFKRYADPSEPIPTAPPQPEWDNDSVSLSIRNNEFDLSDDEFDGGNENESTTSSNTNASSSSTSGQNDSFKRNKKYDTPRPNKRARNEDSKVNPKFCDESIVQVEAETDPDEVARVRRETQNILNWNGITGFPGAQPVSMAYNNYKFLAERKYMVSWKADGTRYLMYINGRDMVFMIDRDNSVFRVRNLFFPHRKDLDKHLMSTLIDGEFVVDIDPTNNQKIPRYLIYDIIKFEADDVGKTSFYTRLQCINKEIIFARGEAIKVGKLNKLIEPFSVRQKQFFPITDTKKLLSEDFTKKLSHGIDGLIYQPVEEPYKGGRCDSILKWKPPSMNSVDFRLDIIVMEEIGGLPEKKGYLYVTGYDQPFSSMKITRAISGLHGKIIECRWNNDKWEFMRERVDKSYPNHYNTAMAVCDSIKHPITEELLLDLISKTHH